MMRSLAVWQNNRFVMMVEVTVMIAIFVTTKQLNCNKNVTQE